MGNGREALTGNGSLDDRYPSRRYRAFPARLAFGHGIG